MSQLAPTNATLDFFVDFGKVRLNVKKLKMDLHALNYLLRVKDLRQGVEELWRHNRDALNPTALEILIAVRPGQDKQF